MSGQSPPPSQHNGDKSNVSAAQLQKSPDVFVEVRQKAQHAAKYFNTISLPNGNLPRSSTNSTDSSNNMLSNKYGATWVRPSDAQGSSRESSASKFRTLPRKVRPYQEHVVIASNTKTRCKSSSETAKEEALKQQALPSFDDDDDEAFDKDTALVPTHGASGNTDPSPNWYNTVPRNFELSRRKPANRGSILLEETFQSNGDDLDSPLIGISRHAEQPDCSKQEHSQCEFVISYTLPYRKTKYQTSTGSTTSINTSEPVNYSLSADGSPGVSYNKQRSCNAVLDGQLKSQSSFSESFESTEDSFLTQQFTQCRDSSTVLADMRKKASSYSYLNELHHYERKKERAESHGSSPARRYKQSRNGSPISGRASPTMKRRNKDRSKYDALDHKILLNKLESEKEADDMILLAEIEQAAHRRHHFAHYDWQSMTFQFQDVLVAMEALKRKNTPSGASKAATLTAAPSSESLASKNSTMGGSQDDLSYHVDDDEGLKYNMFNDLVASCPYFRNEVGGETDRVICVTSSYGLSVEVGNHMDTSTKKAQNVLYNQSYVNIVENDKAGQLLPPNSPSRGSVSFGIEQIDGGACYYRTHFFEKDHQNFMGLDERYGPIIISLRRERVADKGAGGAHQYRIIVRTSELCTLRGSILEDAISSTRQPSNKGFPSKEVLEYVCPEINLTCLKVANALPKVHEQIMKVDEQNVNKTYKVGVLYCRAGQTTEEDMYNNEHGSDAFKQFLDLMGHKVKLNGFDDFRGGLDVKADTTGFESVFTTFNGYKIMFHVSTLLPFSPNNRQQLMRKRHIGNDITTIIFQEPGSEPFNPKHIRSHFQHVFVIVRVHNPCSHNTCYSVAVTRSRNIPRFGPPIAANCMFPISSTFREFLLTKVINGENTAHKTGKFKALAMNTREQYLRDLVVENSGPQGLGDTSRFTRFSKAVSSRRLKDNKDKQKTKPEYTSRGGLTWHISVVDYRRSERVPCILGMSDCVLLVVEKETKQVIFSIPCQAVLGWTVSPPNSEQLRTLERELLVYYGRGERITFYTDEVDTRDDITLRLERFTKGCETIYRQLRRNARGELGFHVNYEGVVVQVEPDGFAAQDGLKQSSRLVEICKVAVVTMTHEEIIDLLRTSDRIKVVVIPPNEDGTPRKCSMELYHLTPVPKTKKANLYCTITPIFLNQSHKSRAVQKSSEKVDVSSQDSDSFIDFVAKGGSESSILGEFSSSPSKAKPPSKDDYVDDDCKTTLATSPKHAVGDVESDNLLNVTNAKLSSSNLPKHNGHDVGIANGKFNETILVSSNCELNSSNSNNNSSYGNSLNHSYGNTPSFSIRSSVHNNPCRSTAVQYNQNGNNNNNNNTPSFEHENGQSRSKRFRSDKIVQNRSVLKTPENPSRAPAPNRLLSSDIQRSLRMYIAETEAFKKSQLNLSQSSKVIPSSHAQSRSEPVGTPVRWNDSSFATSRSGKQKKPLAPTKLYNTPSNAKKPTDRHQSGPRVRPTTRKQGSPSNYSSPTVLQTSSNDLQSSLIRLLSANSPAKPQVTPKDAPGTRKSPRRINSQKSSPKRRTNATSHGIAPPLHRTMSDESLCGARTDDLLMTRHRRSELRDARQDLLSVSSTSVDSLAPSKGRSDHRVVHPRETPSSTLHQISFPLPATTDWDHLLHAAEAAEVFESSNVKSQSMDMLNGINDSSPNKTYVTGRKRYDKRIKSVEYLNGRDFQRDKGDVAHLQLRHPTTSGKVEVSSLAMTSQSPPSVKSLSDSERRLENIEREMKLLQEKLQAEQNSKKVLEKEVSTLRRDNTLLLRQVCLSSSGVINGYKQMKPKSSRS